MKYIFSFLLLMIGLIVTPEMNKFLEQIKPRHVLSLIMLFMGFYCSMKIKASSFSREVAIDSDDVAVLNSEEIPNDILGFISIEVLAGEDVHRETLSDWPAVDGHVRRGDDAHTCDSTFVLEGV